jgi:hypothetical protein
MKGVWSAYSSLTCVKQRTMRLSVTRMSSSVSKITGSSRPVGTVETGVPAATQVGGTWDQLELQQRPRRLRRLEPHPHQVQEGDEVLVGDLVEPIDDHFGHPREQLDEGDARGPTG